MEKVFSKDFLIKFMKKILFSIVILLVALFVFHFVSFIKDGSAVKSDLIFSLKYSYRMIPILILSICFSMVWDYIGSKNNR